MTKRVGVCLAIREQLDVEEVRRAARDLALSLDFQRESAEVVALAASELATNLVRYAVGGQIDINPVDGPGGPGIEIASHDAGPGIGDLAVALSDGFSTGGGLGGGLGSVRRLMDEFELNSGPAGTIVVCRKWCPRS